VDAAPTQGGGFACAEYEARAEAELGTAAARWLAHGGIQRQL
jgi:hypothetical protein